MAERRGPQRRAARPPRRALAAALVVVLAALAVTGCASRRKRAAVELPDARALFRQAEEQLARRDLRRARLSLERINYRSAEERAEFEPLVRLMQADVTFYQGASLSLIDARALYQDFVTLYADHPRAPYAQLQAGVCSLKQANDPARDQTETLQAIRDFQEVLRRYPDSGYARVAREKLRESRTLLAEHEFVIGKFYLKKKAYAAAAGRFKRIVDRYPDYPEKEKLYFHLGQALLLGDNSIEGKLFLDKLVAEFPDGQWSGQASQLLQRLGTLP